MAKTGFEVRARTVIQGIERIEAELRSKGGNQELCDQLGEIADDVLELVGWVDPGLADRLEEADLADEERITV